MDKPDILENIDAYIAGFPEEIRARMAAVRLAIRQTAPEATETISWGMPTFKIGKRTLVQFAGFKNHIGFFPYPETVEHFRAELTDFHTSKGGVQLPHNKPLPLELIKRIVGHNREKIS